MASLLSGKVNEWMFVKTILNMSHRRLPFKKKNDGEAGWRWGGGGMLQAGNKFLFIVSVKENIKKSFGMAYLENDLWIVFMG